MSNSKVASMRALVLTNDAVLLSFIETLLQEAGVESLILDRHISLLEGSIGAFPRRMVVSEDDWPRAARVLKEAGLEQWIANDED
jgi:hypothetical protein